MPISLDTPPPSAARLIKTGIVSRLPHADAIGLSPPVELTRPILRRYLRISKSNRHFYLSRTRNWDYFVLGRDCVALASLREGRDSCSFERLAGGETSKRLYEALAIAANELGSRREQLFLRIFECHSARLLSIVAQSKSGRGRGLYVNVVDRTLVPKSALKVTPDIHVLRDLVFTRVAAMHSRSPSRLIEARTKPKKVERAETTTGSQP